jgi:hypothetical protein
LPTLGPIAMALRSATLQRVRCDTDSCNGIIACEFGLRRNPKMKAARRECGERLADARTLIARQRSVAAATEPRIRRSHSG